MQLSNEELRNLLHNVISCYRDHINVYRTSNPEEEAINDVMEAAQQSVQADRGQADGVGTLPEKEDWLNEPICSTCGHSKSRHQTAGGFCKHCTCNEFVEPATQPHS